MYTFFHVVLPEITMIMVYAKCVVTTKITLLAVRLSQSAPHYRCQTPWLTCARCLRYALQRSNLPQLESGSHFMTAVCVHVDHIHRKYDR